MDGFKPERLRAIRLAHGLGQEDLTARSGVAQNTISEAETGRRTPRPSTLRKLAAALGVEVGDFFEAADSPKAPPDVEGYLRSIGAHLSALDEDEFLRAIEARREAGTLRQMITEMKNERTRAGQQRVENPNDPVVVAAEQRAAQRSAGVVVRWTMEAFRNFTFDEEEAKQFEEVLEEMIAS